MKKHFYLDASALKGGACWRALTFKVVRSLRSSSDLEYKKAYGSAGHIFLDNYYKGKAIKDAARLAVEYYRNFEDQIPATPFEFRTVLHLIEVIKAYVKQYPVAGDGIVVDSDEDGPLVEKTFCIPVRENNDNILFFCGTIDLCCKYFGIENTFVDHKFTGLYYNEKFFDGYEFDIQTAVYSLAYTKILKREYIPSFVINGVFLKKGTEKARLVEEFDGVTFKRSPVFSYSKAKLEVFETWLERKFDKMWETINSPALDKIVAEDYDMATCKTTFGLCEYFSICSAPVELWQTLTKYKYNIKQYEPLKFREL